MKRGNSKDSQIVDARSCCHFLGPDIHGTPQKAVRTGRAGKLEAGGGLQPAEASRPWPQSSGTKTRLGRLAGRLHVTACGRMRFVQVVQKK